MNNSLFRTNVEFCEYCKKYNIGNRMIHCISCSKCVDKYIHNTYSYCDTCKKCYSKKNKNGIICNRCKKCIHNIEEHSKQLCIDDTINNLHNNHNNLCCICLDYDKINIKLHCCNNLIHLECVKAYLNYSVINKCPLCNV